MVERSIVYSYASSLARATLGKRYDVQVLGENNIPQEGPCIVAPNHIKLVDPYILIGWVTRRQLSFLNRYDHKSKTSLELIEQVRMLGTHALGSVMIDRTAPGIKATKLSKYLPQPPTRDEAFNRLKQKLIEGQAVCIFPQGERGSGQQELMPGITYLALDSKIVPVPVITACFHYIPQPNSHLDKVQVNFGEAFLPIGDVAIKDDRDELLKVLSDSLTDLFGSPNGCSATLTNNDY